MTWILHAFVKREFVCITQDPANLTYLSFGSSESHWKTVQLEWSESEVAQLCPTLCDPVDCNLPGSSIHGILQARILEWVAISFFRGSSWPRDWTRVSHLAGRRFNLWATVLVAFCRFLRNFYIYNHVVCTRLASCLPFQTLCPLSHLLLPPPIFSPYQTGKEVH